MLRQVSIGFLVCLAFAWSGVSRAPVFQKAEGAQISIAQDSLALVAFYEETLPGFWTRGRNWLSGPLGTWFGVTVTDGRVTRLELPNNNVSGTLTARLGDLTALQVLDLSANSIYGKIPASFDGLAHLETLNLSGNFFTEMPDSVAGMAQLRILDLGRNNIYDDLPADLAALSSLEVLDLNHNSLSQIPNLDALRTLGVLQRLDLSHNNLAFDDIEPLLWIAPEFYYDGQLYRSTTVTGFEGEPVALQGEFGGQYNQYQWYRGTEALMGETSDRFVISDFAQPDADTYILEVTNRRATRLRLRHFFEVKFDSARRLKWLDIGVYHHVYNYHGAMEEGEGGMEYPAIMRESGHIRTRDFWIGVKDWTDAAGETHPYKVVRNGHRSRLRNSTPLVHNLIGRHEDTFVEVDGQPSFDKEAVLDAVDPGIPADRMIHNVFNTPLGITVDRRAYAYANEHHDDYHIISYQYCNTGNIDLDDEIELPDQELEGVYFYRTHSWRGNRRAAWAGSPGQVWGKYAMHDVVGDGNALYPVDFTAQYAWSGFDPEYDVPLREFSSLGAPLVARVMQDRTFLDELSLRGDTLGRLGDPAMVGRMTLHADNATTDRSYDPALQPAELRWLDNDWFSTWDSGPDRELYLVHIMGKYSFSRDYPHFADTIEPTGTFWEPSNDPSQRSQAGHVSTTTYGPYAMPFGSCINIAVAEGAGGLSHDAALDVGRAYVAAGASREAALIPYDANGDGQINTTPFDYDKVFVGTELQTKNQWVMSARDSLFSTFYRARDLYRSSGDMMRYPIVEPPRAPLRFSVWGADEGVELEWQAATGGAPARAWALYRTEGWVDNLYVSGCLEDPRLLCGYEHIATMPAAARSYLDTLVTAGVDYYYYLQAIGDPQPVDALAITGTPNGQPLRSGRYLTQTYDPVSLSSAPPRVASPPETLMLQPNYPNPFMGTTSIQYGLPSDGAVELSVYDMLGRRVAVLVDGFQPAGQYEVQFDAGRLASGVYVYLLVAGDARKEHTMLLVQ
ncbi:MAG: T9SS type A sorting domain-containing protein [Bacteroidota bacterium]